MSSFPSMIANEPPPLEMTSDEEDSEEFRTPGLKLDVVSAEPSPLSTPLKRPVQASSSPGKGQCAREVAAEEHPYSSAETNGHLDENLVSSFGKRPSLQGQSSEEGGLKTPGSTSETGPHSTPSSPSEQFSDCQNHEFEYEVPTSDAILSSPKQEFSRVESPCVTPALEVVKVDEGEVSCDTVAVSDSIQDESAVFKDAVEQEESNNLSADSLENELKDTVENMCIDSHQMSVQVSPSDEGQLPQLDVAQENSGSVNFASSPVTCDGVLPRTDFDEPLAKVTHEVEDSEDFGDFEAFPTSFVAADVDSSLNASNNEMKTSYIGEFNDEDDDGFGDFASIPPASDSVNLPSATTPKEPTTSIQSHAQPHEEEDDDFADFQDFQDAPSTSKVHAEPHPKIPSRSSSFSQSFSSPRTSTDFSAALESKFDNLIKTVIPKDSAEGSIERTNSEQLEGSQDHSDYTSIDKEISGSSDSCWTHVQDFEESKGLLYKWLNSLSQQKMYKSLKIDTSNIVYTEKWGAIEVPKFAASMVETPLLQPQVFSNSSPANYSVRKSSVPTPDDASNSSSKKAVSKEARQILQQIPDISFMTAKTLVFPQTSRTPSNSLL